MPINERGRYYIGRGKNIKHIVTANSKEELEKTRGKKNMELKFKIG